MVRNFHWFSVVFSFLSLLAYSQKALCRHWCKNDGKVISIVLVHAVKCNLRSQRDWVQYLLSSHNFLCFIKHCYGKEEFDTDRSYGFLTRLNRIVP